MKEKQLNRYDVGRCCRERYISKWKQYTAGVYCNDDKYRTSFILGLQGRDMLLAPLQFDEFWYDLSLKANLFFVESKTKVYVYTRLSSRLQQPWKLFIWKIEAFSFVAVVFAVTNKKISNLLIPCATLLKINIGK